MVITDVLDPGEQLPPECASPRPGEDECWAWTDTGVYRSWNIFGSHQWTPVNISEEGSLWFCSRCRRIERRRLEVGEAVGGPV